MGEKEMVPRARIELATHGFSGLTRHENRALSTRISQLFLPFDGQVLAELLADELLCEYNFCPTGCQGFQKQKMQAITLTCIS